MADILLLCWEALGRLDGGGEIYYLLWRIAWRDGGLTRPGLDKQSALPRRARLSRRAVADLGAFLLANKD